MKDYQDHQLIAGLDSETMVITPNRRLAATLLKRHQAYQRNQDQDCWHTPTILPINSFIKKCWDDYTSNELVCAPFLLNPIQEQSLWEKIIIETKESAQLLQIADTARLAKSAWKLLKQWCIDLNHPLFETADDYKAMQQWALCFQTICENNRWVDEASLPSQVNLVIKQGKLVLPQKIIVVGFNELSPQLTQLFDDCESENCVVNTMQLMKESGNASYLSLADTETELLTMARWAKRLFDQSTQTSIGCVIPNLECERDRVLRIFSEVFAAPLTHEMDEATCPFNVSAGKALLQYPLIQTAFQLLALQKKSVSLESLSYLLATPFIGNANSERIQRAKYDALLRRENITTIDLKFALNENNASKLALTKACPALARHISAFLSQVETATNSLTFAEWAQCFNALLALIGWPGERSLNSKEYQLVEAWLDLLQNFMTLDQVQGPVTYHDALQTLLKIASNTMFQTKTPEARVQILGLLEAAALPFDYLWVAGMDDLSWPPQPKPNPFVPKALQRQLNMPHATAERELRYCENITKQFKQSAKDIIFSHADKNEGSEQQASPLIRELPLITVAALQLPFYQTPHEKVFASRSLESLLDENAPVYMGEQPVRGGTNVIKLQALCPFKAFAEWRLYATTLETPLPGLRGKERGTIIHKALELIWDKLHNQTSLLNLDEQEYNQLVDETIDQAMTRFMDQHTDQRRYLTLEKKRVKKLLTEWLTTEKIRPPFTVLVSEKSTQITLNKLTFTMRIDRIDELDNRKKLIIDYKTGKQNEINVWFSERPEDPQLPLYALHEKEKALGITFAEVVSGDCCFKGISQGDIDVSGIRAITEIKKLELDSWSKLLERWENDLTKLSDDFYNGVAKVDPKDPPKTCAYCEIKPLCRINEEIS